MNLRKLLTLNTIVMVHCTAIYSQNTEYQFSIGTGLFHYNYFPSPENSGYNVVYFNNYLPAGPPALYSSIPRGNEPGFSWHLSLEKKRVGKRNFIFEWGLYFENRESKKQIKYIFNFNPVTGMIDPLPASGEVRFANHLIGINAYWGKRWNFDAKTYIDALFGVDFMVSTNNKAHLMLDAYSSPVYAPPNGLSLHKNEISNSAGVDGGDLRMNGKLELGLKNWGVNIGYAIGLQSQPQSTYSNYYPPIDFNLKTSNTSRYLYTSLFYRIKKKQKKYSGAK